MVASFGQARFGVSLDQCIVRLGVTAVAGVGVQPKIGVAITGLRTGKASGVDLCSVYANTIMF